MSISRVRVYELTRELDLETKDILGICERLSIPVKSHSSTITEAEADRIRAFAQNRDKSGGAAVEIVAKDASTKDASISAAAQAKQEILIETVSRPTMIELQKPPTAEPKAPPQPVAVESAQAKQSEPELSQPVNSNPPNKPGNRASNKASKSTANSANSNKAGKDIATSDRNGQITAIAAPPTPPKSPQLKQPPARPPEPVAEPASAKIQPPADQAPLEATSQTTAKAKSSPKADQAAADVKASSASKASKTEKKAVPQEAKKPELIKPVPRNVAIEPKSAAAPGAETARQGDPTSSEKATKTTKPGKPTEPQDKPTISVGSAPKSAREQPARPQLHRPKPVKDAVLIERGITAPSEPKPQQILQPPVRPSVRAKDAGEVAEEDKDIATNESGLELAAPPERPIKLDRPTKVSKRAKTKREEEEEEDSEVRAKKPNKLKRYKVIEDDIDDLDDALGEGEGEDSSPLSMARPTARPPKPKTSRPAGVENKPIPARQTRKPSRGDRRSSPAEKQIEKPELIELSDSVTVQELADQMMVSETEVIRTLFMKGVMVNINQTLDVPTARMVAEELGYEVEEVELDAPARKVTEMIDLEDIEDLVRRPPVVTIMGHVDHGKTTLLDSIRKSKVAQGEAGGITQHIGAYHVDVEHEDGAKQVVFLDTPGHEAFTAMRARGARVTDIAILVVAADDGVQPQTIEAISHAKAAGVPIVVAINKVDKPEAQPDRIRQELTEYGLVDEEWGGETIMVPVSAIEGSNLDTLLDMILLVAEIEDLQANPNRTARGTVIEAHLDKARGPVATFLVQNGSLRVGDVFVAGSVFGKVRAMIDDRGDRVDRRSILCG
jgi:translation initiation factor IF-2